MTNAVWIEWVEVSAHGARPVVRVARRQVAAERRDELKLAAPITQRFGARLWFPRSMCHLTQRAAYAAGMRKVERERAA